MTCPHCGFEFRAMLANGSKIPPVAPVVCEQCAEISLLIYGHLRKATDHEIEVLKTSPAWSNMIEPARRIILRHQVARKAALN